MTEAASSLPLEAWLDYPEQVPEEELNRSLEAYPWCGTLHLIRAKRNPENSDFVHQALLRLPNSLALERWVKLGQAEPIATGQEVKVQDLEEALEPEPAPVLDLAPEVDPEPSPTPESSSPPEPAPELPERASFEDWIHQVSGADMVASTPAASPKQKASFVPRDDDPLEQLYAGELAASGAYLQEQEENREDPSSESDASGELKPRRRNLKDDAEYNTQLDNRAKRFSEFDPAQGTETLAAIYESQSLYKQAIAIFEQLALKFPQKSAYFAGRIKELEKKCLDS